MVKQVRTFETLIIDEKQRLSLLFKIAKGEEIPAKKLDFTIHDEAVYRLIDLFMYRNPSRLAGVYALLQGTEFETLIYNKPVKFRKNEKGLV